MKTKDFKELLIRSLDKESDAMEVSGKIQESGVNFKFNSGFTEKVLDKVYQSSNVVVREIEYVRNLNFAFTRIALTGVAAIVILLISIFIMQGSLSVNSFLGIGNIQDESLMCLLTGN